MRDNGSFRDTKMGFLGSSQRVLPLYTAARIRNDSLHIFAHQHWYVAAWRPPFFFLFLLLLGRQVCPAHQAGDITRAPLFRFPFFVPLILAARFPRERIWRKEKIINKKSRSWESLRRVASRYSIYILAARLFRNVCDNVVHVYIRYLDRRRLAKYGLFRVVVVVSLDYYTNQFL